MPGQGCPNPCPMGSARRHRRMCPRRQQGAHHRQRRLHRQRLLHRPGRKRRHRLSICLRGRATALGRICRGTNQRRHRTSMASIFRPMRRRPGNRSASMPGLPQRKMIATASNRMMSVPLPIFQNRSATPTTHDSFCDGPCRPVAAHRQRHPRQNRPRMWRRMPPHGLLPRLSGCVRHGRKALPNDRAARSWCPKGRANKAVRAIRRRRRPAHHPISHRFRI